MHKYFTLILITFLFSTLSAQNQITDLPVASTDGLWAAKANPAALSFGNAAGLGYTLNSTDDKFLRQYSIILNSDFFGYVYNRYEGVGSHRFNLSIHPWRNVYLGANIDWGSGAFKEDATGLSALVRPWDFLSLASVNQFYDEDSDWNIYRQGIAIRPLAFFNSEYAYRLAFTVDTWYTKRPNADGKETKFAKPSFGVQTELFDGINIDVVYNSEMEQISANIGISLGSGNTGTLSGWDKDNNYAMGSDYIFFASEDFRAIDLLAGQQKWYELKLNKPVVDKSETFKFGPFKINPGNTIELSKLVQKLNDIGNDKSIDGVLVKADGFATNFANYLELESAFNALKASGKKLVFYYTHIGNLNYAFAASVADEIWLNPNGGVQMTGMSIEQPYMKELLDTLGIEVVNFRSHKYKTAFNFLSEKAMTDAEKEVFTDMLSGMMDEYKRMISAGRKDKISGDLDELIDNGPYITPDQALELKLVDKLVYEEDIKETLEQSNSSAIIVKKYFHSKRRYSWSEEPSKRIAIIYAQGDIHEGTNNPGQSIGSKTFARAIKQAREDNNIEGIILRVNSGGGSSVASDIIAHQVDESSKGKNQKPIVASFGGVAGSGGYYIGAYADYIIAQPVSITGSIGVIGMVFNAERLLDKIHINVDGIKEGKNADIGSWAHSMTDEQKAKVRKAIGWYYERFTKAVAEGRGMDINAVDKVAQGRIWMGKKAKDLGLVDEIGGMNEAYLWMKKKLNTNKLVLQEFDGQDEYVAFKVDAELPWVKTEIPFIPRNLVEQYKRYRHFFENSTEVAYYLTPVMMQTVMK